MKQKHLSILLLTVVTVVVLVLVVSPIQICRDWAYICENTGSRKGHREWTFGPKTGHRYQNSPLEEFLQTNASGQLSHRWTSYAGTGKNVFGRTVLFGHGRPGAILQLRHEVLRQWIDKNDDDEVHQLYDLLVAGNQPEIDAKIESICEEGVK